MSSVAAVPGQGGKRGKAMEDSQEHRPARDLARLTSWVRGCTRDDSTDQAPVLPGLKVGHGGQCPTKCQPQPVC